MMQPIRQQTLMNVPTAVHDQAQLSGHDGGQPTGGGAPTPMYCNPFLVKQSSPPDRPRNVPQSGRKIPDILYGVLDQGEILDDGSVVLMFGTVAGDWLQALLVSVTPVPLGPASTPFYASMPLYLLEVRYASDEVSAIIALASSKPSIETALLDLEGIWVKIALGSGGRPALLFDNLFGDPIPVGMTSIEPAEANAGQFLTSLDPLTAVPDAAAEDIENALLGGSAFDEIAVYDVGQGSTNGFISNRQVVCYFDFGGGVASNTHTFPPALASFCQCNKPPIILSHWDHDHWSSEGRDTRVHSQTWIAPRQASTSIKHAPHHSALVKAIQTVGSLLVWPSSLHNKRIGQFEISLCKGSSKNTSGLALEVHPPPGQTALPVLMPADAGYDDLRTPPRNGQFDAIVCPHHGGRSNSPKIPQPPSGSYQRLLYSYGLNNTYKHPLYKTYDPHHMAKWFDNRAGVTTPTAPPHVVRNTEDRTSAGLGHVGFDWATSASTSALACGANLDVQQR